MASKYMSNFFISLANMLRLRGGPQDIPGAWQLTIFLVAAYLMQQPAGHHTGGFIVLAASPGTFFANPECPGGSGYCI